MAGEEWSIGRLLTWTADYLKKQGAESPRLDAEVLLAHARGCQRLDLYTAFAELASDAVRATYRELVKQRAAGKPVAYLVGRREFYSLPFHVSPAVLIPRPETEFLVIEVLDRLKQQQNPAAARIVDVGTGSGAIAISIARHAPSAQLLALDLSPAALEVAQRNARELGVAERVEFRESDLLSAVSPDQPCDFVVSNPPYVSEAEWSGLAREVRDHEPRLALVGGVDGTDLYARLVPQAAEILRPGGWLILEISPQIQHNVEQLIQADGRFDRVGVTKDLAGLARVVHSRRIA
ncbi:MAG: peptide chain release factor N(5)-glutamine methyltransferase [Planctomycetota bacterium]